jgi:hypothetical protein
LGKIGKQFMSATRVSDLTVDELWIFLRDKMQALIHDELQEALGNTDFLPDQTRDEYIALDLPVIDLGPWPENLSLRREDMYGDDER